MLPSACSWNVISPSVKSYRAATSFDIRYAWTLTVLINGTRVFYVPSWRVDYLQAAVCPPVGAFVRARARGTSSSRDRRRRHLSEDMIFRHVPFCSLFWCPLTEINTMRIIINDFSNDKKSYHQVFDLSNSDSFGQSEAWWKNSLSKNANVELANFILTLA